MFNHFSRSWQLVKSSWAVLRQDRQLLVFPLMSAIAALFVVAFFIFPLTGLGALDGLSRTQPSTAHTVGYATGFLFYVSLYFVIFFFNAALVGAAMIRFDGGTPTIGDGLRVASSKIGSVLGYSILAATVGVVLRFIQERVGFAGKIIVGLLGVGWTVATYLVVPVLVVRATGPFQAVKESATILKKTWGENVVGQAGMGVAFALIQSFVILLGALLLIAGVHLGSGVLILFAVFMVVAGVIVVALLHAALEGIYAAALYRYATGLSMPDAFNASTMQMAFAPKK